MNTSTPTVGSQPDGGSIKESIAALRSILMIDTPTKSLLSPSVAAQNSRAQQWDELSKLRSKASELKHQIQEATNEAAQENRKRKTLQTTYDALAKHRKELSVQLELVSKSREAVEEKLASMRKNLNEERVAISKERAQWRPEINQLRREKKKWEESSNTFEARCVTAEQHAQQSERRVATLEKELVETQVMLQAQQSFQVTLQPRIEQAEKARHVAEENVSLAQNELERIKSRHQKSLASMLNIQQNLKKKLKEVREEYKVTERKLEELKKDLDDAQTTQTLAIEKQREAMVALEAKNSDYDCLKEKINILNQELGTVIEAKKMAEEKHERLQKEQQQSLACLVQDNVSGDLPNSMMALETLISTAIDTHGEHVGYTFIRKLLEATHGIKAEFHQLQSAKKEAEVKLNTTVAVDKTMEYDLAMSRERLREAQDQLLDSREEAERLRAELAAVRLKQTTTTGDKRSLDDRSELEDDDDQKDEDDFEESDTKRRKGENYFGVIDV